MVPIRSVDGVHRFISFEFRTVPDNVAIPVSVRYRPPLKRRGGQVVPPAPRERLSGGALNATTTLVILALVACAPKKRPAAANTDVATDQVPSATDEVPSATVTLPCEWAPGFAADYELTRSRTQGGVADFEVRTPVHIERTSVDGADGWRYDPGDSTIVTEGSLSYNLLTPIVGRYDADPAPLDVTINEDGTLRVLDVETHIAKIYAGLADMPSPPGVDPRQMIPAKALEEILRQEPGTFFQGHCVQLDVGEVFSQEVEFPNPFAADPIPGTISTRIVTLDPAAGTAAYLTVSEMDATAIKDAAYSVFSKVEPDPLSTESLKASLSEVPPFQVLTRIEATYSLADGFPNHIRMTRQIGGDSHPKRRSDTWAWTRRPAE